jgi:RNA polymerase sigma factor (sigma-70 family)
MSEATLPGRARGDLAFPGLASDQRLARRAAAGDERAFAAIFRCYHQRLYRYCLAILGNPEDAEDALQNTMAKALRSLPGEERPIELKPWLYRVAHNEAIDLIRRRRGEEQLDPELAGAGAGLAEAAETRERLRLLLADLEELPERQRGALLMRELSGLGFEEIGTALGTSAAVARQTVYEARLGLRQIGEGREMDCTDVTRALSDGDGRVLRRRDIRSHLRACPDCRCFREEIGGRQRDLAALSPLPALAAAGVLQGLLGGSGGGSGGGIAAAVGGGAAKSVGASAALKATAAVAVVAALGTAAADRGGLVDAGLPGGAGGGTAAGKSGGEGSGNGAAETATGAARSPTVGRRSPKQALAASARARELGVAGAIGGGAGKVQAAAAGPTAGDVPAAASLPGAGHGDDSKGLPSASAHGQQTAAAHKGSSHTGGSGGGNSDHVSKPEHPAHPSHPTQATQPKPEHPAPSPGPAGGKSSSPAAGSKGGGETSEAASTESAAIGPDNRHAPAFQP